MNRDVLHSRWGAGSGAEFETTPGDGAGTGGSFGPLDARYQLRRHLRDGGSASVYEAYDEHLMRPVAVKRYFSGVAPASTSRFWREARLTGWLTHPNIVPVYDVLLREDGGCDLVMKLVEGETFGDRISRSMMLPHSAEALQTHLRDLLKVCDAVAYAHSRGVVHRDLKPANIMVGPHGEVYVMDWGIAKVLPGGGPQSQDPSSQTLRPFAPEPPELTLPPGSVPDPSLPPHSTSRGMVVGTPAYMAPEQADGDSEASDARTDIFCLGAILYEILTGAAPYTGTTWFDVVGKARQRDLIPPDERAPERTVSPELRRVCLKAMARARDARYQSVEEFTVELLEILRGGGWFETKTFAPGEAIVREGDPADEAFVLKSGRCRVIKSLGQTEQELRTLEAGEVFGEVGLITGEVRSATVIALEPVEVQVISSRGLKFEMAQQGLVGTFLSALAVRFLDIDQKLFDARNAAKKPD